MILHQRIVPQCHQQVNIHVHHVCSTPFRRNRISSAADTKTGASDMFRRGNPRRPRMDDMFGGPPGMMEGHSGMTAPIQRRARGGEIDTGPNMGYIGSPNPGPRQRQRRRWRQGELPGFIGVRPLPQAVPTA
jgi:hypothetical protein